MEIRIGAILLMILAAIGFSGTIASQHVEGHKNSQPYGPPRIDSKLTNIKRQYKPKDYRLSYFQKYINALKCICKINEDRSDVPCTMRT